MAYSKKVPATLPLPKKKGEKVPVVVELGVGKVSKQKIMASTTKLASYEV